MRRWHLQPNWLRKLYSSIFSLLFAFYLFPSSCFSSRPHQLQAATCGLGAIMSEGVWLLMLARGGYGWSFSFTKQLLNPLENAARKGPIWAAFIWQQLRLECKERHGQTQSRQQKREFLGRELPPTVDAVLWHKRHWYREGEWQLRSPDWAHQIHNCQEPIKYWRASIHQAVETQHID